MTKKVFLSALMLFGALACISVGIVLAVRSFSESSSLFLTVAETVRVSNDSEQYLGMVLMAIGVAIIVFVRN